MKSEIDERSDKWNAECLPFKNAIFDGVIAHHVIEHVRDDISFIREIHRVLKMVVRLEWIIFYYTAGKENVRFACKHFGISRKTFCDRLVSWVQF